MERLPKLSPGPVFRGVRFVPESGAARFSGERVIRDDVSPSRLKADVERSIGRAVRSAVGRGVVGVRIAEREGSVLEVWERATGTDRGLGIVDAERVDRVGVEDRIDGADRMDGALRCAELILGALCTLIRGELILGALGALIRGVLVRGELIRGALLRPEYDLPPL